MVHSFVYEALPARVIFATLSAALLTEEMARIGMKRPIVLATPLQEPQAREIAAMLDEKSVGVFAGAVMHTPVEITEKALSIVREAKADGVVAIGGDRRLASPRPSRCARIFHSWSFRRPTPARR